MPKKNMAIGVFCLCAAGIAQAAETQQFYVGAGVGQNRLNASTDGIDLSGTATAFKVFTGVNITQNLAAEVAYIDGGTVSDTIAGSISVNDKASAFQGSLLGLYPVGNTQMHVRAGFLSWHAKATATDGGFEYASASDSGTSFSWGAGTTINFQQMAVRLEYEGANINDTQLRLITASLIYKF